MISLFTWNNFVNFEPLWVRLVNSLDTFAACELFMVVVIFVVAYPVERFINRERYSAFRNAATYAFIGIILMGIFFAITMLRLGGNFDYTPVIGLYVTAISTITAFVARLIYPWMLRLRRTTLGLTIVIAALAVAGPAVPTIQRSSPQPDSFYPKTYPSEAARATWDVDENTGAAATNHSDGIADYDPNKSYAIWYQCKFASKRELTFYIRKRNEYGDLATLKGSCSTVQIQSIDVELGKDKMAVTMLLDPSSEGGANINGVNTDADAWAVLAPKN